MKRFLFTFVTASIVLACTATGPRRVESPETPTAIGEGPIRFRVWAERAPNRSAGYTHPVCYRIRGECRSTGADPTQPSVQLTLRPAHGDRCATVREGADAPEWYLADQGAWDIPWPSQCHGDLEVYADLQLGFARCESMHGQFALVSEHLREAHFTPRCGGRITTGATP